MGTKVPSQVLVNGTASNLYGATASVGDKVVVVLGPVHLGAASLYNLRPTVELLVALCALTFLRPRISDYGGKSLNVGDGIVINPDIPENT